MNVDSDSVSSATKVFVNSSELHQLLLDGAILIGATEAPLSMAPNTTFIEDTSEPGAADMNSGHWFIPDSIHICPTDLEIWSRSNYNLDRDCDYCYGSGKILPGKLLKQKLESYGITVDDTVVVYEVFSNTKTSTNEFIAAARLAWILLHAGVQNVHVFEGSVADWQASNRNNAPKRLPRSPVAVDCFFNGKKGLNFPLRPEFVATTEQVKDAATFDSASRSTSILADVRSWDEFNGVKHDYQYMRRLGRIPGARWARFGPSTYVGEDYRIVTVDGSRKLREPHEIESMWKENKVEGLSTRVIFYCGTGWRSSLAFLFALSLGWNNIANYDGGWLEYAHTHPDANEHVRECPNQELPLLVLRSTDTDVDHIR